jgi:hypothetical protein
MTKLEIVNETFPRRPRSFTPLQWEHVCQLWETCGPEFSDAQDFDEFAHTHQWDT